MYPGVQIVADDRLDDLGDLAVGNSLGLVTCAGAVLHLDPVDHVGGGGDEVQVELALEPLAHDLHVQQARGSRSGSRSRGRRRSRLVGQRRVVELQLVQRVAQRRVVVAVDR
jgi:hypothetical protein